MPQQPHIINMRKQVPMQLVQRCLMLQMVYEIGVEKILMLNDKKFRVFLIEIPYEDGTTDYEIDWEFCIFGATDYQYERLMECFHPKPAQQDTNTPSIIIESPSAGSTDEQRPPLTIA